MITEEGVESCSSIIFAKNSKITLSKIQLGPGSTAVLSAFWNYVYHCLHRYHCLHLFLSLIGRSEENGTCCYALALFSNIWQTGTILLLTIVPITVSCGIEFYRQLFSLRIQLWLCTRPPKNNPCVPWMRHISSVSVTVAQFLCLNVRIPPALQGKHGFPSMPFLSHASYK